MLVNSDDIIKTKEHIDVMQAFIDGKEIEYRLFTPTNSLEWRIAATPMWDYSNYEYRIKPSEPEFKYPIYKRLKGTSQTVVKFTSIDSGVYISTHKHSIYKPGDDALNMAPHTESSWEDCTLSIDEKQSNTEKLFEVIYYCEIMKEFEFVKQLYKDEDLENKKHLQKTGRSFIIDKDTNKIIKVNHN